MRNFSQWDEFKGNRWKEKISVRDFVRDNYTPYDGDESFLEGPTEATNKLWGKLQELQKAERANNGVLDMETEVVTSLTAYGPGYIDENMKNLEKVVGLQTDKPLKRAFMPYGGIKMAEQACEMYGYKVNPQIHDIFTKYFKTHNQGVFDIYTPEMKVARHNKILTGLPDTYGRGRIVGDYRRVALYGIDALIEAKQADFAATNRQGMRRGDFQLREEIFRPDPCPERNERDGSRLRLRYLSAGKRCQRSIPVAVFRIPGSHQDPEWCCYECGTYFHFPRYLYRKRYAERYPDRERSTGTGRPHGYEIPYGKICQNRVLQSAVLR